MNIYARAIPIVQPPRLGYWVFDDDDAIMTAYRKHGQKLQYDRALWEARSGPRSYLWAIWAGDIWTGEIEYSAAAAEARILQIHASRISESSARPIRSKPQSRPVVAISPSAKIEQSKHAKLRVVPFLSTPASHQDASA